MSAANRGVTFTEDKGFIDSYFVVEGPYNVIKALREVLAEQFNKEN